MKTPNGFLVIAVVTALVNSACGGHTVAARAGASRSDGLFPPVVAFLMDIVEGALPGGEPQAVGMTWPELTAKDDIKQLRKLFPNHPSTDGSSQLGGPTDAVKKKASRMGLRKSKRYMKSLAR
ncbi:MAG: hypothetical protein JSW27_00535 [Phycisphaerales bacterium]|nr:MAG: hypothetical protein JSW27_00535 [Phycisphaerales bacterium]